MNQKADAEDTTRARVQTSASIIRALCTPGTAAVVVVHFCHGCTHYIGLAWLPTYFNQIWLVPKGSLALVVLPYVAHIAILQVGGRMADWITHRYGVWRSRVLMNSLGFLLSAACYAVVPLANTTGGALLALVGAVGFMGLSISGFETNKMDLVPPEHIGLFQSVANTIGNLSGVLAVPAASRIVQAGSSSRPGEPSWDLVFVLMALLHVFAAAVFATFASVRRIQV